MAHSNIPSAVHGYEYVLKLLVISLAYQNS